MIRNMLGPSSSESSNPPQRLEIFHLRLLLLYKKNHKLLHKIIDKQHIALALIAQSLMKRWQYIGQDDISTDKPENRLRYNQLLMYIGGEGGKSGLIDAVQT
jgi:hypothetical protein